jgi:hypothetical protein
MVGSPFLNEGSSFSEEKEAKRLLSVGPGVSAGEQSQPLACVVAIARLPTPPGQQTKVLWFFLSRKNPF